MIIKITDRTLACCICCVIFILFFLSSCTVVRKYQKDKPFVYKNIINLNADDASSDEKVIFQSRLNSQLADSAKVRIKDVAFVLHYIDRPPAFDTFAVKQSAENMVSSLRNLGYYNAGADYTYTFDSLKDNEMIRATTTYTVNAGRRTLIDTFAYLLDKPELQQLAVQSKAESPLKKNSPVTKSAISEETSRLVNLYRNNGYYKFTAEELRLTGDTSIEALTTVSDDPFETLRLLAEANEKRNRPTIKLAIQLNKSSDSTRLNKYYINNIYILPDYVPGDSYTDSSLTEKVIKEYTIRYHNYMFRNSILVNNIHMKKGDMYRQEDYLKTLNSFYQLGVWESPGIDIIEKKDTNLLDMVIKLSPIKKFGFEGNIELSYSASSNTSNNISAANSGNLLGVSGNVSILNRNLRKEAIRMTNSIRAGVEFNTGKRNSNGTLINSNELSFTNNILIPKFVSPFKSVNRKRLLTRQTFINTNLSQINRINFFNQQIFNIGFGYNWKRKSNHSWTYRPFNFDYRRLYNRSDSFNKTLAANPFLRYSFNTALVMGQSLGFTTTLINRAHPNRRNIWKINIEESGLIWGRFKRSVSSGSKGNFLNKYLKEFIRTDIEFTHTISHPKSALVFRAFAGVGIPLSKTDTTLPFFKQYFGGGPNSMRGWPVRGIGVGSQLIAPYGTSAFNDRTGDIQLEGNTEYRYNIAPLFSSSITLKGALFADVGNIWNFKNTKLNGTKDSTQFTFKDLYKQLGVSAGTGFRIDFNYFLIRFDLALRFKRPDISENDGWQMPDVNLKNIFGNSLENKRWRYENFNFTIGIDYPF